MENILVSDEDFPFSMVVKAIEDSPVVTIVLQGWRKLGRALNIKQKTVLKCQKDLNLGTKEYIDVIEELLREWYSENKTSATLDALQDLIENDCGWNELAASIGQIIQKLEMKEKTTQPRHLGFEKPGIGIKENYENNLVVAENVQQVDNLDTGKKLCDYGAYNLSVKSIHAGASCKVFKGHHISTGRPVAVKILKKEDNCDAAYDLELKNWKAVGGLQGTIRHIVHLYEYRSFDRNECFFTMEWAKADLEERITELNKERKQEPGNHHDTIYIHDKVVGYLRDVADALQYLHFNLSPPYIHRDVKPKNIFIFDHTSDENGKTEIAKLGDFGVSQQEISGKMSFASGTLEYMPPESIYAMSYGVEFENTWRVDIFSFGVTCHVAMSKGKHPFGDDAGDIQKNIEDLNEITTWPRKLSSCTTDYRCANHLFGWMMTKPTTYDEDTFPNRPNMEQVIRHPFFFTLEEKKKFFIEKNIPNSALGHVQPDSSSLEWRKAVDEMLYNFLCCTAE